MSAFERKTNYSTEHDIRTWGRASFCLHRELNVINIVDESVFSILLAISDAFTSFHSVFFFSVLLTVAEQPMHFGNRVKTYSDDAKQQN